MRARSALGSALCPFSRSKLSEKPSLTRNGAESGNFASPSCQTARLDIVGIIAIHEEIRVRANSSRIHAN